MTPFGEKMLLKRLVELHGQPSNWELAPVKDGRWYLKSKVTGMEVLGGSLPFPTKEEAAAARSRLQMVYNLIK